MSPEEVGCLLGVLLFLVGGRSLLEMRDHLIQKRLPHPVVEEKRPGRVSLADGLAQIVQVSASCCETGLVSQRCVPVVPRLVLVAQAEAGHRDEVEEQSQRRLSVPTGGSLKLLEE